MEVRSETIISWSCITSSGERSFHVCKIADSELCSATSYQDTCPLLVFTWLNLTCCYIRNSGQFKAADKRTKCIWDRSSFPEPEAFRAAWNRIFSPQNGRDKNQSWDVILWQHNEYWELSVQTALSVSQGDLPVFELTERLSQLSITPGVKLTALLISLRVRWKW